jgi:hypothetical protein
MRTSVTFSKIIRGMLKSIKVARVVFILLFVFLLVFQVSSQPAVNNEDVKVWAVPGEQKVRPKDQVEKSNLIWSGENKKITVAGAGNEHVPFQIVITTPVPPGWRPEAPGGFFVTSSDLTSANGKSIPKNQVSL